MSELDKNFLAEQENPSENDPIPEHEEVEEISETDPNHQNQKKKKIIIWAIIIGIIIALVLGLGLGLGLKSDSGNSGRPDLIVMRGFESYDRFEYTKTTQSCVDALDFVYKSTKYCENSTATVSFQVINVTSSKSLFPSDSNEFIIYGLYVHLKNLTVTNATNSLTIGGADFPSDRNSSKSNGKQILFLKDRRMFLANNDFKYNSSSTNYSSLDDFPLVKVDLFDNGTIWKIFKPTNISEKEKLVLVESIKEFSPQLAKKLYDPSRKADTLVSLESNYSNQSRVVDFKENFGSVLADPSFAARHYSNGRLLLQKSVDKSNLLDISLPDSSDYSSEMLYVLNTNTGHLEQVHSNASSFFNQSSVNATYDDEDPNYFAGERLKKSDYASDNRIPNPYARSFSVNSSSLLNLSAFHSKDRDSGTNLKDLSRSINFEEIDLDQYLKNSSKFIKKGNMSKSDSVEMVQKGQNGGRILEMDVTTIDDFKNKYIVYPLSKTDLWGFQLSIEVLLSWKPNQNSMSYDFYLYEERTGFFIDLKSSKLNVPLAQTNKELENFLYHSYFQVKDLSDEIKIMFDSKLFTNVTYLLTNVEEAINFPFNIPLMFETSFTQIIPDLISKIQNFIDSANAFIQADSDHIFANPLESSTPDFQKYLQDDVRRFLGVFDSNSLPVFQSNLASLLNNLREALNSASSLFPDVIKDLQLMEEELRVKLLNMNAVLSNDVVRNLKNEFSSMISNMTNQMLKSYSEYSDAVRQSGYSKGLSKGLEHISAESSGTVNKVIFWFYKLQSDLIESINSDAGLKPDFAVSNNLCLNASLNLSLTIDNLTEVTNGKSVFKNEIIPYDNASASWGQIMKKFQDFRFVNFNQKFDFPMILNETVKDSIDYLEKFYEDYDLIEKSIGNFSAYLRNRVDKIIYFGTERIKDFDIQIRNLLSEDTSEIKVLYSALLKNTLSPFLWNINTFLNDTINGLDNIFGKILQTAEITMKSKNDKIIFCDQEADYLYSISATYDGYLKSLEAQINASLVNYLAGIQQRIIDSLKIPDLYLVSSEFYNLNQIIADDGNLFNAKKIETEFIAKIYTLFNDTIRDLKIEFNGNVTKIFDKFKVVLNQKTIDTISMKLPLYTETYSCGSRPITPSNPIPNTFCVLYSLTLNEISSQPITTPPQPLSRYCSLFDESTDLITTFTKKNLFIPLTNPQLDVVVNSEVIKFSSQAENLIIEIKNATGSIKSIQTEQFREIEDRLEDLIDKEKYAWSNYLLKNMSAIIQILSNSGNQAFNLLTQSYGEVIRDIGNYVSNNSQIKDFVVADMANLLTTIQNDGDYFVDYFKKQASWGLSGSLDRVMMVHQKNNEILVNVFNYTYIDHLIPKALGQSINKYLVDHQLELNQIYNQTTEIRNALSNHLNSLLTIRYKDFQYDFAQLINQFTTIISQASSKRENLITDNITSFQLNSYEQMNFVRSISDLAKVPLIDFDDSVIESAKNIANLFVNQCFELLPKRFEDFHHILNNSDNIINELIRQEVKKLLDESLDNIYYFFESDSLLKIKFQELAVEYNRIAKLGLQSFAAQFEKEIQAWKDLTYTRTMELLQLDDYCVNEQILNQYEKFQQYILSSLTTVYSTNLPDLQDIFFHILSQLKTLVKGTIYNSTLSSLFNLTNGIPTILKTNNGESISLLDLISDFKDQYKLKMNDAINYALRNIYNDSSSLLEELTDILETVYSKTENDLLTNLTAISEKMTIYNEDYYSDRMGIDFGNVTLPVPGQDGHFSIVYFDFLINQTKNYETSINRLDLSYLTQLEKFRSLKRYLDVDFEILVLDSNLQNTNIKLVKKIADYNEMVEKLNYDLEAEMLGAVFQSGMDSLEVPLKQMLISQEAIRNLNQTNILLGADLSKYVQNSLQWIANYVKGLSQNLGGISTVEILIQMENARKLYIDNLPMIFLARTNEFDDAINKKISELVDNIEENFYHKLIIINLNNFDNEMEKKALMEKLAEIKLSSPVLNWKNQDASDLASSIINPLSIIIANRTSDLLAAVNNTWDASYASLKASLKPDSAAAYDNKKKLYTILLEGIQQIRDFSPLDFHISDNFKVNVSNVSVNFTGKVKHVITEFEAILQPLTKVINESLSNLESNIKNDKLIPIIRDKVSPPVQDLAQKLQRICSDLLNEINQLIIEVMTQNINPSRRLLSHISDITISITGLQDVINLFTHSLSDSIDLINNLPTVHDIDKSVHDFAASLDQNNFLISTYLDDNVEGFTHTMDTKGISALRASIMERLTSINNFARNAISQTYQNITTAVQSFNNFDWKVVELQLIAILYQNRDNLTEMVLNEVEPLLNNSKRETFTLIQAFPLQLPIPGIDVLNFGFGISGTISFNLDMGIDRYAKKIFVNFNPGIAVNLEGHSILTLLSADYNAFIRGTLVQAMLTFKAEYKLIEMRSYQTLCLNLDFGSLTIGVSARYRQCRRLWFWFYRGDVCGNWGSWENRYASQIVPLVNYFGCLNLEQR